MTTRDYFLPLRGQILSVSGSHNHLNIATAHTEGLITPFYTLDLTKGELSSLDLPTALIAISHRDDQHYFLGRDLGLYTISENKVKRLADLGSDLKGNVDQTTQPAPLALIVQGEEIFILWAHQAQIFNLKGKLQSQLELKQASVFALSPDGRWLAVGFEDGSLQAFNREDQAEFMAGESCKVHQTAIRHLLFDVHELQVISSAGDKRLMMTQLRGEPEVKERSSKSHEGQITALHAAPGGGFYSIGTDGALKHWAGGYSQRQAHTTKTERHLTVLDVWEEAGQRRIVLANDHQNLSVLPLDDKARPTLPSHLIYGLKRWLKRELSNPDSRVRASALNELAQFADRQSVEALAKQALNDSETQLRSQAASLLESLQHPAVDEQLLALLKSPDQAVQLRVFKQLLSRAQTDPLDVIQQALAVGQKELGLAAIQELESRSGDSRQALDALILNLNNKVSELRLAAFAALSRFYTKEVITAVNLGLSANHDDVRAEALKLGYQQGLLEQREFLRLVRRHLNDPADPVRQIAYLLSLLTRPALAELLRGLDEDLQRRLHDLDGQKAPALKNTELKSHLAALSEAERAPLVEAMATPALDVCLEGAKALALIQDPRAFGVLLQLSREKREETRIAVSKAFGDLDDPNAIPRLRLLLHDAQINVADAAFSALNRLYTQQPEALIEAGLNAPDAKIRLRTLSLLARQLKKNPNRSLTFLEKALNDRQDNVRREAFKTLLNAELWPERSETLRFALRSVHASIRQEVLLELEAQKKQAWTQPLLGGLLNDPEQELRNKAFELLRSQHKDTYKNSPDSQELHQVYQLGLESRYADLRRQVLNLLTQQKKKDQAIFELIESRLQDPEADLRLSALKGLLESAHQDSQAQERLQRALDNPHLDIRVGAATAQASQGNPNALDPLLAVLELPEPPEHDKLARTQWQAAVYTAITGLAALGDPQAFMPLRGLILDAKGLFRAPAAAALRRVARETEPVAALLGLSDQSVKRPLALALAALGDDRAASEVFAQLDHESLAAAVQLRKVSPEPLYAFFDVQNIGLRQRALKLCLLLDLGERPASPETCLAGLAAAHLDIRLQATAALEHYAVREALLSTITELINTRSQGENWTLPESVIENLAAALAYCPHPISLDLCESLLFLLDQPNQELFENWWQHINQRYAPELASALKTSQAQQVQTSTESLLPLAVGTYVGILRLNDASAKAHERQTALRRLAELAERVPGQAEAIVTCLKVALYDSSAVVREEAFERLKPISPAAELAAEALATEHRDIARKALELLLTPKVMTDKKRDDLLVDLQQTATNGLEEEAQLVLVKLKGEIPALTQALTARAANLRYLALRGLGNLYAKEPSAREALVMALQSGFSDVRQRAALLLAEHHDQQALPELVNMLRSTDRDTVHGTDQRVARQALDGFKALGDKAASQELLKMLKTEPKHALATNIIDLLGEIGELTTAQEALALLESPEHIKLRNSLSVAIDSLSGYTQPLKFVEGQVLVDESQLWVEKAKPLHPSLCEELLRRLTQLADLPLLLGLIPRAAYCLDPGIDRSLELLSQFKDLPVREAALSALGLRLRELGELEKNQKAPKRADTLGAALSQPEADSKFLAAEGLALAGHDDGVQVLLTALDMLQNLAYRQRAVLALGKLAHPRALDQLLRLAAQDGHALQESAVEALGHLKKSNQASRIFEQLKHFVRGGQQGLQQRALTGLRWFDSPEGWKLIREQAEQGNWNSRQLAIELLRYDSDKETAISCLSELIRKDESYFLIEELAESLKHLYRDNLLEAEYLFLEVQDQYSLDDVIPDYLKHVCLKGDPERLLESLDRIKDHEVLEAVSNSLLNQPAERMVKPALKALTKSSQRSLQVILQLLGRAKQTLPKGELERLTEVYFALWHKQLKAEDSAANQTLTLLQRLAWFAGRVGKLPELFAHELATDQLLAHDRQALGQAVLEALDQAQAAKAPWKELLNQWVYQGLNKLRPQAAELLAFKSTAKEQLVALTDSPQTLLTLQSEQLWKDSVLLLAAVKKGTALSQLSPEAIPALSQLLKQAEPETQAAVLELLGHLAHPEAEAVLAEYIAEFSPTAQESAQASKTPTTKKQKKAKSENDVPETAGNSAQNSELKELTQLARRLLRRSQRQRQQQRTQQWQEVLA